MEEEDIPRDKSEVRSRWKAMAEDLRAVFETAKDGHDDGDGPIIAVENQLDTVSKLLKIPAYKHEENRTNRCRLLVYYCMVNWSDYPKIQENGLHFYRNLSLDNYGFAYYVHFNYFHITTIISALRSFPDHRFVQLHGLAALSQICRLSKKAAERLVKIEFGMKVLISALKKHLHEPEVNSIASALYHYLEYSLIDGFKEAVAAEY